MSAAAALLLALAALSESERVRFSIERDQDAAQCPSDTALAQRVRERIGSEPFSEADDARALSVSIRGDKRGLIARVRLHTSGGASIGERELRGKRDCVELTEQLVLAIAIAIDPLVLLRPVRQAQGSDVDDAAADVAHGSEHDTEHDAGEGDLSAVSSSRANDDLRPGPVDSVVRRNPRRTRERPIGLSLRLVGLAGGGVAAPVAPGLRAALLWQGELWAFDVGVRGALPARVLLADAAGPLDVHGAALQLAPGLAVVGEAAALRGSVVVDGGALFVRGVGLEDARSATVPWLALGVRGGMDIVLIHSLALVVDLEALVPALRPRFVDSRSGEVFAQAERIAWNGGLGLQWNL